MTTLNDRIDELTEEEFWNGEDVDDITTALMSSWLEVMSTRHSTDEIVAALYACAEVIRSSTYH